MKYIYMNNIITSNKITLLPLEGGQKRAQLLDVGRKIGREYKIWNS